MEVGTGHFLVYGATMSGKTSYVRSLLKEQLRWERIVIFSSTHDWDLEEPSPLVTLYRDFANISDLWVTLKADILPTVVIFDDFNEEIVKTHEDYVALFTKSRHYKTTVINMAHTNKAVPPAARANCKYVAISCSMYNNAMIKEVQSTFATTIGLSTMVNRMKQAIPYAFCLLHNGTMRIEAPSYIPKFDDVIRSRVNTLTVNHMPNPDEPNGIVENFLNAASMTSALPNIPAINSDIRLNKAMTSSSGDVVDNSSTVINTGIGNVADAKAAQFEAKVIGLKREEELNEIKDYYRIRNILINGGRTPEEEIECLKLMRKYTPLTDFNLNTMYACAKSFIQKKFPNQYSSSTLDQIKPNPSSNIYRTEHVLRSSILNMFDKKTKVVVAPSPSTTIGKAWVVLDKYLKTL